MTRSGEELSDLGITVPVGADILASYAPYAVEFRYPYAVVEDEPLDRGAACRHVQTLRTWVEAWLAAEAGARQADGDRKPADGTGSRGDASGAAAGGSAPVSDQ